MPAVVVPVPYIFNAKTMYELIAGVVAEEFVPRADRVVFDLSRLRFIDTGCVTIFANLVEWLLRRGVEVEFAGCDPRRKAISYMDDCLFFKTYAGSCLTETAAPRVTTMPFRSVLYRESHDWLENRFTPWLAGVLDVPAASLRDLRSCIRELFNNIDDHSTEQVGCMHVQWFPNNGNIGISLSDFGVGIPAEMARAHRFADDGEALLLAAQDGVSSKRGGRNRGAGLALLIDNVVGRSSGAVRIYSLHGQLTCSPDGGAISRNAVTVPGVYPGTLVNITLPAERIEIVEDEREDLEW